METQSAPVVCEVATPKLKGYAMSPIPLTAEQRRMNAQIAANTRWAGSDAESRRAATRPALNAMERKFAEQVDPDNKLSDAERAAMIKNAKRAYFTRLAYQKSRAAQLRRAAGH